MQGQLLDNQKSIDDLKSTVENIQKSNITIQNLLQRLVTAFPARVQETLHMDVPSDSSIESMTQESTTNNTKHTSDPPLAPPILQ